MGQRALQVRGDDGGLSIRGAEQEVLIRHRHIPLFPFDGGRRFARDVIDNPVDTLDLIDDPVG